MSDGPFTEKKKKADRLPQDVGLRIGKSGVTETLIGELKLLLKNKRIIKVKYMPSYIQDKDKKKEFEKLASLLGAKIVHKIGFTVVLKK